MWSNEQLSFEVALDFAQTQGSWVLDFEDRHRGFRLVKQYKPLEGAELIANRKRVAEYYQQHLESERNRQVVYYQANHDKVRAKQAAYRAANRDKLCAAKRAARARLKAAR